MQHAELRQRSDTEEDGVDGSIRIKAEDFEALKCTDEVVRTGIKHCCIALSGENFIKNSQ